MPEQEGKFMRTLSLIFHRIKHHIRSNPLLIAIFVVGCFICSLAIIILYGNTMPHMNNDTNEKYYRTYDIHLNVPTSVQQLNITELMSTKDFDLENIILNSYIEELGMDVKASTTNEIYENYLSDAKFSTNTQLKQIILSEIFVNYKKYEKYSILNETYAVAGYATNNYIEYNEFLNQNLEINRIRVVFEKPLTSEQLEAFSNIIKNQYPSSTIRDAQSYVDQDRTLSVYSTILLAFLYFFMFLSLAFIFYYIFKSELHENIIFRIHGASSKHMLVIILGEQLIWVTIAGIISSCIHNLFYTSFFESFNRHANIKFALIDYLIIVIAIDLVSLICLIPFVKKIINRFSYKLRQEANIC